MSLRTLHSPISTLTQRISSSSDDDDDNKTDAYSGAVTSSLTNGGSAGLFWGYILVVMAFFLIYASLAEMTSM